MWRAGSKQSPHFNRKVPFAHVLSADFVAWLETARYSEALQFSGGDWTMLKELQERTMASVSSLQPAEMMKTWFPMGLDGWLEMQKAFWAKMTSIGTQTADNS